ncbi:acylneuraminate cytidylyltransferase family protein [Pseudomonas cichorii]|uniref:acylneuraminate cytidylyltransferase family protein n=1 Tax=Pseudomonas cichorii TaxID=36746 RepID=UPI0018E6379F|nr:acylneuraminate cytidylyltransferase family protein [Pseudomonas cichorii]MBI6853131.1 acylneuraminate cytidylyltransferase family protein [Pseudomonas cichorii]MBX8514376.1 acylneuraminate cytidylyltransferase family protein [Pseudomonas cichorii]
MTGIYAFIFARGNSKGLPEKNIKRLGEKPLLAHSIDVARQVPAIQKIFVSTDSLVIADVARQYGAEVIERPCELATDEAPEWLAWQHAIQHLVARGERFDLFVSLPATSPLRSSEDVQACIQAATDVDVVVTVTPASRSPFFNMLVRDEQGISSIVCSGENFHRRQDAPEVYDMTTVAYVARPQYILDNTKLFAGRVRSVVVPRERAVDIDDIYDFKMAEFFLTERENNHAGR